MVLWVEAIRIYRRNKFTTIVNSLSSIKEKEIQEAAQELEQWLLTEEGLLGLELLEASQKVIVFFSKDDARINLCSSGIEVRSYFRRNVNNLFDLVELAVDPKYGALKGRRPNEVLSYLRSELNRIADEARQTAS